ncbi:MAG: AsmA family protein [Deltaproteobacteria bacterium]|nr:AsmA family protein [Deltaproteobacteria bacterium]
MGRTLKWIIGIFVGVIVAVIVVVYIILASYDFNDLKPQISNAALEATGRELRIGGDIDLDIGLTPALVLTDIGFQNAPWGSRPELATIKRFEIKIALVPLLSGEIEIKRFILTEPDILIETDKSGKSNLLFEKPKKVTPEKKEEKKTEKGVTHLPALSFNQLLIENGKLAYRDGVSGKSYQVMLTRVTTSSAGMESPLKINLDGDYQKEPFNLSGTIGPLAALTDPGKNFSLNMTAKALNATVTLDGYIKDVMSQRGMDLGFNIQVPSLKKISELAGKPLPPIEALKVTGRASDTGKKSYKISDLKVSFGNNEVKGYIELALAKKTPAIAATISSQNLDLRPLFPKSREQQEPDVKEKKPAKKAKKVFPDDPLELDALKQVDVDAKLRIGKMILPQLAVSDLKVDISLRGGHLKVMPLKATIGGGALDGSVFLRPQGKAIAVVTKLKVKGFQFGSMLKEMNITELIEGNIDVDIDLKGQGASVAELMSGLDGYTSIIMGQGRIHNKYIDLLGRELSSGIFRLLNPVKVKMDYTAINCMVSRFDIRKGIADSTALVFDTSLMSVVGTGKINLGTEKLSLSLNPSPKKGLGGFSLSLGELAKPFKLAGTLAEPSLAIDPTKAALAIVKTVGGVALFGPAGIAAALMSKSKGDENPCLSAIEAEKSGVKSEKKAKKPEDTKKEYLPDVGKTLKKLFGR